MRLIDADKLQDELYHEAFETDTDLQKWDGGCWIRYKMVENVIDDTPTIDAVEVVRCKECDSYVEDYFWYDDEGEKHNCHHCTNHDIEVQDNDYCSNGGSREE